VIKRLTVDKSFLILVLILAIVAVFVVIMANVLKTDPFLEVLNNDFIVNVVLMIEREGKPLATQIFMFYPGNARGALLDVPPETGLIIRSLNRSDRLDVLYDSQDPAKYIEEIQTLIDTELEWFIRIDEQAFIDIVDLLDGFQLFVPHAIKTQLDGNLAMLPAGSVRLDGSKTWLYANYIEPDRPEAELVARRQNLFHALLSQLKQRAAFVLHPDVFPLFEQRLHTNLSQPALEQLLSRLGSLDTERLVYQRLTGNLRLVDGTQVLFPHYDGELVRDIVKQTLNALLSEESFMDEDQVFSLEILNGTKIRGLAQRAAEVFQSFGYDVVSVDNADRQDVERTVVISREARVEQAAATVGRVIRCESVELDANGGTSSLMADFVIVLGSDFNGRYCEN